MNGDKSQSSPADLAGVALLPEGVRDDLPPFAGHEVRTAEILMQVFQAHGFERVNPPLIEFEETLSVFDSPARQGSMFRLLDPLSQRTMGLRSDMTPQVARIATTRLAGRQRPLRLAYSGHVVRVQGSQLRPTRQFRQAGVELIGSQRLSADLEVILLARDALQAVGLTDLTLDLTTPTLVPQLCDSLGLGASERATVLRALDEKNVGGLHALADDASGPLSALLAAAGPADKALAALKVMDLPGPLMEMIADLAALVDQIKVAAPELSLTVDPGESHGFEYKTGISFSFLARGVAAELGRGGRYHARHPDGSQEPAIGFSIYLDTIMSAIARPETPARLYLPWGTSRDTGNDLRAAGWRTVQALSDDPDPVAAARSLACSHIYQNGAPIELDAAASTKS